MGSTFSLKMVMGRWPGEGDRKVVEGDRKVVLGPQNCLYWGLPPPRPLAVPGGLPDPQTPWQGGPAAPHAFLHTERLRLSGSPFCSWYQDLGSP